MSEVSEVSEVREMSGQQVVVDERGRGGVSVPSSLQ